jgi:hypothetical protein
MKKSFKHYLEESQKQYNYRIKMVVHPDEEKMEAIERLLRRYDLLSVSTPQKINNKDSLEFRDIDNVDEWYIDVSIGVPFSSYILQQELRAVLDIPEKFVVVRAENEPIEVESEKQQMLQNLNAIAKEKGLQKGSLLSTDRFYLDAEQPKVKDAFGDKYNKTFLNFLADIAANRKSQEFDTDSQLITVKELRKVKNQEPMQDIADFNAEYDTPKPVYKAKAKAKYPVDPNYLTSSGNFDDDSKTYFKVSKTKAGKTVTDQTSTDQIRTPRTQDKK